MEIQPRRFIVLDALRGIAALLVFMYHMSDLSFLTTNVFVKSSGIFVDLFFVLSGFVIYHNYKNKIKTLNSAKRFIVKRFKRLVPLHIYTIFVLFILELIKLATFKILPYTTIPFSGNSFKVLFTNLFLLNSTPLFEDFSWNGQSWSISAEIFCYLLFIIVMLYFFKNKLTTLFTTLIIIILSYLFFFLNYKNFNIASDFNYSFIRAFAGFFFGILIYIIKNNSNLKKHPNKLTFTILEILIVFVIIIGVCNSHSQLELIDHFYIYHIIFALSIFIFSEEKGIISSILSKKLFQNLGRWSYSIYLNHIFMILIFKMICIKILNLSGFVVVIAEIFLIISTIIYSKYTYENIEKRFYKKL